ncbi:PKD domain-containing protein [Segetibacter sp. 3557_3]|nr:PKD domain-containing protein [Segetibacter sp. 3557_3]
MSAGAFFLERHGFRVVQHNIKDLQEMAEYFHGHAHGSEDPVVTAKGAAAPKPTKILRSHAYDVQFLSAGSPEIVGDKPLESYNNYFIGNDPSKWANNCRIFQAVTYKNMYPGVDVRYYTSNGQLKYDVIAHAGADLSKLAVRYDGVDGLQVKNEQLVISTSVGEMKEMAPYAYQVINGKKKEVGCRFKVAGKVVQFNLENYDKTVPLVIDPTLVFSTFSGSKGDNWGYTATYGPDGSFYAGGTVNGTGFPVSTGAFQTNFQGGQAGGEEPWDMGIIKFNPSGSTRLYATYLGGSGQDYPHSLVVDNQNNLVIGGRTNSTNYPTTSPIIGAGGDYDIILTKLNATGTALIGSLKIGGTQRDGVNVRPKYETPRGSETIRRNYGDDSRSEVILDAAGNIYLASNTQSISATVANNFPTTPGSFQPTQTTIGGGRQDGVLIKATPNLSGILFSSYLGGTGDDALFVLALNPLNGNVYVGGNTTSPNLPGDKTGVYQVSYQQGQCDGFVSIVSPDGSTLIKTSYMGTPGNDMLYGLQFDNFGFPYIMGTTTGQWPVLNAAFSQPGSKQYIAKIRPDLSGLVYSTIFGTSNVFPNISPVAFLVDRCQNVYVSGWGGQLNDASGSGPGNGGYDNAGTNGLTVTPDALQLTTDNSDFYFFVLKRDATAQLYGSFFGQFSTQTGGEHVDGGTSRFDRNGVIYQALCANCNTPTVTFPTTPGVWSPTNGSSNCNLAAVKIAFNLAGVGSGVQSAVKGVARRNSGCVPLTVDFTDTIATGVSFYWNYGDGSPEVRTDVPSSSHTFTAVGTYNVRLISIDSTTCNITDTSFTTIRVRNDEAKLDFTSAKIPPCQSTTYQFTNTSTAPATRPFSNNSFQWTFGDNSAPVITGSQSVTHAFPGVGTYTVRLVLLDTNYCNYPDSVVRQIRISPNVAAAFQTPPSGCAPYNARFENTSAGGQQFFWDFGDGTTSTQTSPTHQYNTPGTFVVRLRAVDSATCNISDSTTFTITVSEKPVASFSYAPDPPLENTAVVFTNTSIGATSYLWRFGDGDTLLTTSTLPVQHYYNETRKYTTCLVAINQYGCRDTTCQDLQAIVVPVLDIPNAFTPNGDGINDKVFVRGFGIAKMNWRIFNRWGALVFQTVNRNEGWDGIYRGSRQPKEVYHYVLDVEFTDGKRTQKKGDITLL